MSKFLITVVAVDAEEVPTKNGKRTYTKLTVTYKSDGKVAGKILLPFGEQASAFKALKEANKGDVYTIEAEKGESGYWDWKTAEVGDRIGGASPAPLNPSAAPADTGTRPAPSRSTYETPEERAAKQVYIVRQSSISAAISSLPLLNGIQADEVDVNVIISIAKQFEAYVFGRDPVVEMEVMERDQEIE